MNQPFSPILHLPILLATDGSPTAVLAQQLVMPIVQHLAQRSPSQTANSQDAQDAQDDAKPAFIAIHVQPKPSRFRRPGRQTSSTEAPAETLTDEPLEGTPPNPTSSIPTETLESSNQASSHPQSVAASREAEPTQTLSTPLPDEILSAAVDDAAESSSQAAAAAAETAATDTPSPKSIAPIPDLPPALAALQTELEQTASAIAASLVSVQGRPATEILKQASQSQAGLIALGCHGTGGAREMLVGSVSAEIARYADSHVLIARSAEPEHPVQPNWQHVLLVVTGELATQSAIALTRQLVPVGIQQLTVLCVQPPLTSHYLFGPFATPNPSWQLTQSLQAAQREQSEAILQQAKLALSDLDLELEMLVQTGEPGSLICQVAEQRQANLIIIGSDVNPKRSKSPPAGSIGRRRLLRLTATADYVIHHASCPVLLSRMPN